MMKIENTIKIVSFLLKKQIDKHDRMRIVLLLQEQWRIGWIGNEYEGCHFYPTTRCYDQQL